MVTSFTFLEQLIRIPQSRLLVNIQTTIHSPIKDMIFQASNYHCLEPLWFDHAPPLRFKKTIFWSLAFSNVDASSAVQAVSGRRRQRKGPKLKHTESNFCGSNLNGNGEFKLHTRKNWASDTSPCATWEHKNARKVNSLPKVFSLSTSISKKNMPPKTPSKHTRSELPWMMLGHQLKP